MKARLYYCIGDYEDEIIIEGDSVEELRKITDRELKKRGATYCGGKILEENK